MILDSVNKWLMLAANVGVITGIYFLAIEVNDNTRNVRSQEKGALDQMELDRQIAVMDPYFSEVYAKALFAPGELAREETIFLTHYIGMRLNNAERAYEA